MIDPQIVVEHLEAAPGVGRRGRSGLILLDVVLGRRSASRTRRHGLAPAVSRGSLGFSDRAPSDPHRAGRRYRRGSLKGLAEQRRAPVERPGAVVFETLDRRDGRRDPAAAVADAGSLRNRRASSSAFEEPLRVAQCGAWRSSVLSLCSSRDVAVPCTSTGVRRPAAMRRLAGTFSSGMRGSEAVAVSPIEMSIDQANRHRTSRAHDGRRDRCSRTVARADEVDPEDSTPGAHSARRAAHRVGADVGPAAGRGDRRSALRADRWPTTYREAEVRPGREGRRRLRALPPPQCWSGRWPE